ncbi:hypothetical protein BKA70DRAFT_1099155 [Coprinopsis sp. MPI-PUGE-AT-0042]|nr:hypothetical protein BKA70DRAFT_1099155 [Coprinopsis sp. MPI-PUGE-AT-0042]
MASESRAPSDKELNTYGAMFAADTFAISVLSTSLLVVQIVLVLYGVSGFFANPKNKRKGRLRFIIISVLMVTMGTIDMSFDLWEDFLRLYTGGPDGISYLRALSIQAKNWRWRTIGDAFFYAAITLGDLWRCLVLWTDKKWVVLFPSLAWLGSIAYLVSNATVDFDLSSRTQLAGSILNVTMNIMITFLIVLRVMRARYRAAKAFPDQKPARWYSEVTALVVESAAPLAIFGICFIALRGITMTEAAKQLRSGNVLQRGRYNIAIDVVGTFYYAFCTLSPQMIIVRVTRGKAWNSSVVGATDEGANVTQAIRFAHSARETATSDV